MPMKASISSPVVGFQYLSDVDHGSAVSISSGGDLVTAFKFDASAKLVKKSTPKTCFRKAAFIRLAFSEISTSCIYVGCMADQHCIKGCRPSYDKMCKTIKK